MASQKRESKKKKLWVVTESIFPRRFHGILAIPFFVNYLEQLWPFSSPPFDFFGNLIYENLFKMTFHVKTCQH